MFYYKNVAGCQRLQVATYSGDRRLARRNSLILTLQYIQLCSNMLNYNFKSVQKSRMENLLSPVNPNKIKCTFVKKEM